MIKNEAPILMQLISSIYPTWPLFTLYKFLNPNPQGRMQQSMASGGGQWVCQFFIIINFYTIAWLLSEDVFLKLKFDCIKNNLEFRIQGILWFYVFLNQN